ncbi:MAG: Trm112 family protein [Rhizobiaceae bacterium]
MPDHTRSAVIDPKLLELLACPLTRGSLTYDRERNELVSPLAELAYPVRDGIPIMLASEARRTGDEVAKPEKPGRRPR